MTEIKAARAAERTRRAALLARATREGVRGIADELAILCADCGRPMLVLSPRGEPQGITRCIECGARRFVPELPAGACQGLIRRAPSLLAEDGGASSEGACP